MKKNNKLEMKCADKCSMQGMHCVECSLRNGSPECLSRLKVYKL